MKKFILFLAILSINLSFSQDQSIQREKDFLVRMKDKQFAKEQEQENLDLLTELYNAVNTLQALRKYHYEMRYDKTYLKQYKRKIFYGLRNDVSWERDKNTMNKQLSDNILLYNEQRQRCILYYSWAKQFPKDIVQKLDIDNLPTGK
jgi:hypothetical protein